MKIIIVTSVALLISSPVFAANSATQELQNLLTPISSIRASFKQTVFSENKTKIQAASGDMEFKKPHLFRWHVATPDDTLLVTDGKKLWNYDPGLEQVTVQKYSANKEVTPLSFILDDISRLPVNFTVAKPTNDCYKLEPKQDNPNFANVTVCFRDKQISNVRLLDHLGQTSVFEFSNMHLNEKIADSRFTFTAPAGVDVVGES